MYQYKIIAEYHLYTLLGISVSTRRESKMNYLDSTVILVLQHYSAAGECRSNYSYIVRNRVLEYNIAGNGAHTRDTRNYSPTLDLDRGILS